MELSRRDRITLLTAGSKASETPGDLIVTHDHVQWAIEADGVIERMLGEPTADESAARFHWCSRGVHCSCFPDNPGCTCGAAKEVRHDGSR